MARSSPPPPLTSLARATFEQAKRLDGKSSNLQRLVLVFSLSAGLAQTVPALLWPSDVAASYEGAKAITYVCAVASLVTQAARFACSHKAASLHQVGSAVKRRAMLEDALGESSEHMDLRILRDEAGESAEELAREYGRPSPHYYASCQVVGMARLRDHLDESAFYSHRLYQYAAHTSYVRFAITAASVLLGLVLVLLLAPQDVGTLFANCAMALVAFLISGNQLGRAMTWHSASQAVERIQRRVDAVSADDLQAHIAAFADYEAATASAPAIPTPLYERHRERLEALFSEKRA